MKPTTMLLMGRLICQGTEGGHGLLIRSWGFSPTACKELNLANNHLDHTGSRSIPIEPLDDFSNSQHFDWNLLRDESEESAMLHPEAWTHRNWDINITVLYKCLGVICYTEIANRISNIPLLTSHLIPMYLQVSDLNATSSGMAFPSSDNLPHMSKSLAIHPHSIFLSFASLIIITKVHYLNIFLSSPKTCQFQVGGLFFSPHWITSSKHGA